MKWDIIRKKLISCILILNLDELLTVMSSSSKRHCGRNRGFDKGWTIIIFPAIFLFFSNPNSSTQCPSAMLQCDSSVRFQWRWHIPINCPIDLHNRISDMDSGRLVEVFTVYKLLRYHHNEISLHTEFLLHLEYNPLALQW